MCWDRAWNLPGGGMHVRTTTLANKGGITVSVTKSCHVSPRGLLFVLFVAVCGLPTIEIPLSAQTGCPGTNPPCVLTAQGYGGLQTANLRQGYNPYESLLTSGNLQGPNPSVTLKQSYLLVDYPASALNLGVVNSIYAQPLYVAGIQIQNNSACASPSCNMLVVETVLGSIWAFNADTGATIWNDCTAASCTNAALWQSDCGLGQGFGVGRAPFGPGPLFFAGIVSTPVIDTSGGAELMYVTSLCQTGTTQGQQQWWLHQIDLTTGADTTSGGVSTHKQITASVTDYAGADGDNSGTVTFPAWQALQRPALLEVNVSGASPMIYISFGLGMLSEKSQPFHGWVFGYDSSLNFKFAFLTTAKGDASGVNSDLPACSYPGCSCNPSQTGGCGGFSGCCTFTCIPSGYKAAPNWCGHGAGGWGGSGRGAAANPDSNGTSHAYFPAGNGAFQQWQSDGIHLLGTILNWGETIFDLTFSASAFDSSPSQYFAPAGPVAVQPTVAPGGNTPTCPTNGGNCNFAILNQNDFDIGTCGILLFDDLGGNHRLATCDKAGYGYLLRQANLCGSSDGCYPGTQSGKAGLSSTDPGNVQPFAWNVNQCADMVADDQTYDRITTLAFYPDGSPKRFYFWPSFETLTSFQLSDNTSQPSSGTLSSNNGSVTSLILSGANQVVIGNQITNVSGESTQTVTGTNSDSTIVTISPGFNNTHSGVTGWKYNGYFINPVHDSHPVSTSVQYPGGSVQVTSNNGSGAVVWALANVG